MSNRIHKTKMVGNISRYCEIRHLFPTNTAEYYLSAFADIPSLYLDISFAVKNEVRKTPSPKVCQNSELKTAKETQTQALNDRPTYQRKNTHLPS